MRCRSSSPSPSFFFLLLLSFHFFLIAFGVTDERTEKHQRNQRKGGRERREREEEREDERRAELLSLDRVNSKHCLHLNVYSFTPFRLSVYCLLFTWSLSLSVSLSLFWTLQALHLGALQVKTSWRDASKKVIMPLMTRPHEKSQSQRERERERESAE